MTGRQEQRKIKISKLVSIILAGSLLVILISLYQTDRKSEASFTISQPDESQSETTSDLATESEKTQDIIPVYLVGAICKPGIYQIRRGAYLYELIEQAGGMTDEAAVESVNLARSIDSNQLVRIPTEMRLLRVIKNLNGNPVRRQTGWLISAGQTSGNWKHFRASVLRRPARSSHFAKKTARFRRLMI